MGLSKRILIVMFVNFGFMMMVNIVTHFGLGKLEHSNDAVMSYSKAEVLLMDADMKHDALRSDVFLALLASADNSINKDKSEVLAQIREHSEAFKEDVQQLSGLSLHDSIFQKIEILKEPLRNYIEHTQTIADRAFSDREAAMLKVEEFDKSFFTLEEAISALSDTLNEHKTEVGAEAKKTVSNIILVETLVLATGLLVILVSMLSLRRTMNKQFTVAFEQLVSNANNLKASSQQVSSSSQSLAQGATEQAASLEETAAALEEVSSMSKSNADGAHQADLLADGMMIIAEKGSKSMSQMSRAIQDIQVSAVETENIISIIENIAFQTNLLALNAAVEAARAGDAGKGFAVVAEEVRNLAKRSADAAKETAEKIKRSKDLAENGVAVSKDVSAALSDVVDNAHKTSALVKEIAAASKEQSIGVSQVNAAVTELDKVTQSNAAVAEQSAAASDELRVQGRGIEGVIGKMQEIIFGHREAITAAPQRPVIATASAVKSYEPAKKATIATSNGSNGFHGKASSIIPLDDQDYADF